MNKVLIIINYRFTIHGHLAHKGLPFNEVRDIENLVVPVIFSAFGWARQLIPSL